MTEVEKLIYDYLNEQGLFSQWEGPDGITYNPPKPQLRYFDETELETGDMCLLIRNISAGGGSRFYQTPQYIIAVIGNVGQSEVYAKTYIDSVMLAMQEFTRSEQIIAIDPIGYIGGPYKMESGRFSYDINYTVKVDTKLV